MCPKVKTLSLVCTKEVLCERGVIKTDVIKMAGSYFPHLTHFYVQGSQQPEIDDAETFCEAVKVSCPRLVRLSLSDLKLGNDNAAAIIRSMEADKSVTNIK